MSQYHIHCKLPTDKKAKLLGSQGRLTRLKIHAVSFDADKIEDVLKKMREDNPEYEFSKSAVK